MHTALHRVVTAALAQPWALLPEKLEEIQYFFERRLHSHEAPEDIRAEFQARVSSANEAPTAQRVGSTAIIPVYGTISYRANMMSEFSGGTSTEQLRAQIQREAGDPAVSSIVLDFNSPGGGVGGLQELHAAIMDARQSKPVVGSVNTMSASAAFWIMSACSEVCSTPSGECGSIGVFMMHADNSKALENEGVNVTLIKAGKFKAEANPWQPLTDEAKANLQQKVDDTHKLFLADVAKGRGVSVGDVRENFGQGRMLTAKDAKAAGMIDRIETLDATLQRLGKKSATGGRQVRAALDDLDFRAKGILL